MLRIPLNAVLLFTLWAVSAAAQSFDTSGNSKLNGAYYVREVTIAGQNTDGGITAAFSATGVITFNGNGGYNFSGQLQSSTGGSGPITLPGTYKVGANGLLVMESLTDGFDLCFGAVSGIGPSAIVASATEDDNVDLLIAVPAGSGFSNASLNGPYAGAYIDFTAADIARIRQASLKMTANGGGSFGTVAAAGQAMNLGNTPITQSVAGVTYTLNNTGSGTVSFGASSNSQLVSGGKTLYVSADGNILFGGDPAGYDMLVAIKGLAGGASNATASGLYFVGGIEDLVTTGAGGGHAIDGFYGSLNSTGTGISLGHNRLQSFTEYPFDFTFDNQYTVQPDGTISSADVPFYNFTYGAGGKAFVATGADGLYSLQVGFGAPVFSGTGVFINPAGVVNAANFAPMTNPITAGEIATLFGSGLASGTIPAPSLPLPVILGGVQVTVNGIPAPLFYVSAGQITFLVPATISPEFDVANATIQVTNNGTKSNTVTLYTGYTAPGVFSAASNGVGLAAAVHADGTLITSDKKANTGETIVLFAGGLGRTMPEVPSGAASPFDPLAIVNDKDDTVDFGGVKGEIKFAGLTPGLSGLYQLNVIPGPTTLNGSVYVNIATPDAYTSQTTTFIAGGAAPRAIGAKTEIPARPHPLRVAGQKRLSPQARAR